MRLKFIHDPVFTADEVATVAGITENQLRIYLTRGANAFVGMKKGGRLLFTAKEAFVVVLAVALSGYGLSVDSAFNLAHAINGRDTETTPDSGDAAFVSHRADGSINVRQNQTFAELGEPESPVIALPIDAMWQTTLNRLAAYWPSVKE